MEETKNRRIGSRQGKDGIPVGRSFASPTKDTRRAELVVPPNVVVPILFVPGIMGSNLRNRKTEESVWNASTLLSLAWQWAFRSAKTRQTKLNPDMTEADPEGKIPKVADYAGDDGKPDDLDEAQLRERGWGTVSNYGYGDFMAWLEPTLNNGGANPWADLVGKSGGSGDGGNDSSSDEDSRQPAPAPDGWGAQKAFSPLSELEASDAWGAQCPLYGVGYNWLQSNGKSSVDLATRIDEVIAEWRDKEVDGKKLYRCARVILVTHSMGGLVSRAAVHADYGNAADRILGICHGVMPADGAAACYHHVRSGYNGFSRFVLGKDAAQVTAIFANACGPLELLPNDLYGNDWLKAVGRSAAGNQELFALPKGDPYIDIYPKRDVWWRLIDPDLIDPAGSARGQKTANGATSDPWLGMYTRKLMTAGQFHLDIGMTYHPSTYAHYGAGTERHSYSNIVWETDDRIALASEELLAAPPVHATGFSALRLALTFGKDNSDPARVAQGGSEAVFEIADASEPGDDTVPENSGAGPFIRGGQAVRQSFRLPKMSEGHASSYDDKNIQQIALYSIAKIIGEKRAK